jgi:site-specific DNA-cytosine methylase
MYALSELKFDIEVFYASEIDEDAIKLTKHHFGDRITHLGSVTEINEDVLDKIGPINFLIGGSPCSDLSCVNPLRKGLYGKI